LCSTLRTKSGLWRYISVICLCFVFSTVDQATLSECLVGVASLVQHTGWGPRNCRLHVPLF